MTANRSLEGDSNAYDSSKDLNTLDPNLEPPLPAVASQIEAKAQPAQLTDTARPADKQPEQKKQAATDAIQWTELSYDLGLQGITQEIAANSVVGHFEKNHLQLFLTKDFMEFVNPANQDEICQAIASKLGLSLTLDLQIQDKLNTETPNESRSRQQEEHRLAAIEAIKQEPTVKKLRQAFGAELVESSVRLANKITDKNET